MLALLLETIKQYLPELTERYIENIFLNPDIWKTGTEKAQEDILKRTKTLCEEANTSVRSETIVNMLMHCIEIMCDERKDSMNTLSIITIILIQVAKTNLSEAILTKIISYANIFYIRKLRYYPLQLYYVMYVLLDLFQTGNNLNFYIFS